MITTIPKINQAYKFFRRYKEIIFIFVKYGFKDWLAKSKLVDYLTIDHKKDFRESDKNYKKYTTWERVRLVFEELGPTFIKFGQILSNRPDILPDDLIKELVKLQEDVPAFAAAEAIDVIETELNCKICDVFVQFDSTPVAAASIAQVHKAKLKTGETVAVKIQRPGIKRLIETDLEIMIHLSQVLEFHIKEIKQINLTAVIEEFGNNIRKEIDFQIELSNIERFRNNHEKDKRLYIPKTFKTFSTKKILTLEFIEGTSVGQTDELQKKGIDTKRLATTGTRIILKQIFEYGFFHADPHPGNIYILNDGRICFIDFGLMGVLPPKYREYLGDFIIGFVNNDIRKICKTILKLAISHENLNNDLFETKISELIEQFTYMPLKDINMGEVITKALDIVIKYEIQMPPVIYLLSKAMVTIEGVARKLDPEFDITAHFKPFAKKIIKERLNPLNILKLNYLALLEMGNLFNDLPFEIREILESMKSGKFTINIEDKGQKEKIENNKQIFNTLSLSILIFTFLTAGIALQIQAENHSEKIPATSIFLYILTSIGFLFYLINYLKR